jgi:PAS domain S-box-containing protein
MVHSKKKRSASKKRVESNPKNEQSPLELKGQVASLQNDPEYERIFAEVQDYAMLMLDQAGIILSWNVGAEKITGYAAQEIIGKNYKIFYTREDKENDLSEKILSDAARDGRINYEGWQVRKDGTRFWMNDTVTALHNEDGSLKGYLKITRDLTEKKMAEDNYSNFVEELKLKNEALKQSEERYHKMIVEVSDYAIILLDKNGKILDWNKGAEKVKGYTAKEIVGKSFRLFYPKEEKDSKLPETLLAEATRKGSVTHEGWRIRKDGRRFWGSITITALHNDQDEIIGFSKVTRDLTEKKIAEDKVGNVLEELRHANEQLRQSEELHHKMIDEVQDYAILLLNKEGDIQNWNVGAQVIKGYNAKEVIGKNFRIFYAPEDLKNNLPGKLLKQAMKAGKATHEGWRVRKDGSRFWGSVVITALHNVAGEIIGFSKVTRDLTEKKRAEDSLKASAAQLDLKNKTLERLNEELSSFTHVASHDMKEPLRKIQIFVTRIEDAGFPSEKSSEYLEKIKTSALRMQNLIDDLLMYSQVSNDTGKSERVDLNKILQAVKNDLEIAINEKQAVIEADRLPVVSGISYQLHQLLLNLLSNSIKFSRAGEIPVIEIRTELIKGPDIPGESSFENNKYHHITIRDNGIGFSHQDNDKIFEAFQRLHPKSTFSGTGIGLAIVKKVVDTHNGIISAEGKPGIGATFHLYLPVVQR